MNLSSTTTSVSSRAMTGEAHFFEESMNNKKVKQYLSATKDYEKCKGMKWLLANMSKGRDMSEFFPDVVKNVMVKSVEVKKFVYMFMVHYADFNLQCREDALLSINSFQKDLAGGNQLIRALALRVLTSIQVPDIIQIQLLAVVKAASDSSPYVRKCAAIAIPKIYALDPSLKENLECEIVKLLKDSSTMVLGSTVMAFSEVCPENFSMLHRCYRKLCHLLADMDEWSQICVMQVLLRYARTSFMDPTPGHFQWLQSEAMARRTGAHTTGGGKNNNKFNLDNNFNLDAIGGGNNENNDNDKNEYDHENDTSFDTYTGPKTRKIKRRVVKKGFYSDEEDESTEEEIEINIEPEEGSVFNKRSNNNNNNNKNTNTNTNNNNNNDDLDPDHRLLLKSSFPLLKSRNCGVVLSVCILHYYCGSQQESEVTQVGKSLVRISRSRREIQYIVLNAIASMAQERPQMFQPFIQDFYVKGSDPGFCRERKLTILTSLMNRENVGPVLREIQTYIKHSSRTFVCQAIQAVGRLADAQPEVADLCLHGLMEFISQSKWEDCQGEAVVVIRHLLQQNNSLQGFEQVVKKLASILLCNKAILSSVAKASIVWIVGEFYQSVSDIAPDILRVLAQSFTEETDEVKMQCLNLAVKIYLRNLENDNIHKLVAYLLELTRYDINYDIRDRARLVTSALGMMSNGNKVDTSALLKLKEKAEAIFLTPKLAPLTYLGPVSLEGRNNLMISSLSWVIGHKINGYLPIPDWSTTVSDPTLRDAPSRIHVNDADIIRQQSDEEFYSSSDLDSADNDNDDEGSFYSNSDSDNNSGSSSPSGSESDSEASYSSSESNYDSAASSSGSESDDSSFSGSDRSDESDYSDNEVYETPESAYVDLTPTRNKSGPLDNITALMDGMNNNNNIMINNNDSYTNINDNNNDNSPPVFNKDAYLGIQELSNSPWVATNKIVSPIKSMSTSSSLSVDRTTTATASTFETILRHELGSGLKVERSFLRDNRMRTTCPTMLSLSLKITNMRQTTVRRVKAIAPKDGRKFTGFDDIAEIKGDDFVEVVIGIDFFDEGNNEVTFNISCDRGQYPVTINAGFEEVIRPFSTTIEEFHVVAKTLTGFQESKTAFTLNDARTEFELIPDRIVTKAAVKEVDAGAGNSFKETGKCYFSGMIVKKSGGSDRVLITAEITKNTGFVSLSVKSDSAMICASLVESFKKGIVGTNSN